MYDLGYLKEVSVLNNISMDIITGGSVTRKSEDKNCFRCHHKNLSPCKGDSSLSVNLSEKEANRELLCKITIKMNVNILN